MSEGLSPTIRNQLAVDGLLKQNHHFLKNSTFGRIGGAYLACLKGVQFFWHLRLVYLNLNVPSGTHNINLSCGSLLLVL